MCPRAPRGASAHILLVEDNPGDIDLTREALRESGVSAELHVVEDGRQAMDFLLRRACYTDAPVPDLVLLDLSLPRLDGREVLRRIRANEAIASIPVVVFSSSASEEDVRDSYALQANCYVTKPVTFDDLVQCVRALHHFWCEVVGLSHA